MSQVTVRSRHPWEPAMTELPPKQLAGKICHNNWNNSAADCLVSLKFGTEFSIISQPIQRVKGQGHIDRSPKCPSLGSPESNSGVRILIESSETGLTQQFLRMRSTNFAKRLISDARRLLKHPVRNCSICICGLERYGPPFKARNDWRDVGRPQLTMHRNCRFSNIHYSLVSNVWLKWVGSNLVCKSIFLM